MTLLTLATIPAGTIDLRDARTETTRRVELREFELGVAQVTGHEYAAMLGARQSEGQDPAAPAHPVTWFAAVAWCNAASLAHGLDLAYDISGRQVRWNVAAGGYRLPTEAEWEWACRAGSSGPGYGPLAQIAWTAHDDVAGPQPVGGKRANALGLFDTLGNIWEWCWDYADTARYADYRALRGGGWADKSWSVRASVRRGSAPDAVLEDVGFRVARGAVGPIGGDRAQGWSAPADHARAAVTGPLPVGWTPLRP